MSVVIVGAGGFGREMRGWYEMSGKGFAGFIDDEKTGVLGTIKNYSPQKREEVLVCISNPKGREAVVAQLIEKGATFHGYCSATLAPNAKMGTGCILCPFSMMSNSSQIGDFCIVNAHSSIGHDSTLGNFCTLSSYVDITGNVTVGDRVFFGSGARVLPGVKIGDDCVIGAGAIIVNDVPAGVTMYSQPARSL